MKSSRGFTTIELLIVIAIMAVLAALAIPSYADFFERNRLRGAAEAIYEELQYARTESIKKSMPIIIDFWIDSSDATTWSLGITDKTDGCDPSASTPVPCTIDYDNDPDTPDSVLMQLASTNFKSITMKGSGGTLPSFTGTPGSCTTANSEEACFEPVQGLARSTTGHIQLESSNKRYTLQMEVDTVGQVKICAPSGAKYFVGYKCCSEGPLTNGKCP